MSIPVSCPRCRATGQLPNEAAGQQTACPLCHTPFLVTVPVAAPELSDGFGVWVDSGRVSPPPIQTPIIVQAGPAPVLSGNSRPVSEQSLVPSGAVESFTGTSDWAQTEAERFKGYVAGQLAKLEKLRRENADAESRHEALCVNRTMDLNRTAANLDARKAELDRWDAELRRTREANAAREAEVERRATELTEREAAIVSRETHRSKLEAEAVELSKLVAELRPAVERLELRKTEAEALRSELTTKQTNLDRRLIEVGRSELAVQKRLAELDETERLLRDELEEREGELERQRAVLAEEMRALRSRVSVDTQTPMPRSLAGLGSQPLLPTAVGAGADSP